MPKDLFLKFMFIFLIFPNIEVRYHCKISHLQKKPHDLAFLSLSPSLFLSEIMKNQVLNKIVCSVMKNWNGTLFFSIYNNYKGVQFFLM
jgi:hypothetical protein